MKNDLPARLREWLDDGDSSLEKEMQSALEDEVTQEPAPVPAPPTTALEDAAIAHAVLDPLRHIYKVLAVIVSVMLIGVLLYATAKLPLFGDADTLRDSEVAAFYIRNTLEDTGAVNIVTGIILDYRGFDTLGESHVLFTAVCAVFMLLSLRGDRDAAAMLRMEAEDSRFEPRDDEVLSTAARILTPLIMLFGLYIILNGHLSPGGGFSGGAILGAGLILYQNAFGYPKMQRFFTRTMFRCISVTALVFYSLAKGYHFFTGANGLENGISAGVAGRILSGGLLLPLNLAVGMVVACVMYALYTMFRRGEF